MRRTEDVMGMPITVDVRDGPVDPATLDEVYRELRVIDAVFSPFKADSAI